MIDSIAQHFYIDSRSLRLFRILLACVVIADVVVRLSDFTAHYTDAGVLPLSVLYRYHWNSGYWSVLSWSASPLFGVAVFGVVAIAALLLLAGIQTRFVTIICWVGILSIQNRNPILYQGGDDLLRMLLFWSIFLPVQQRSLRVPEKGICGTAAMAILLQVLLVLFFSGLFKGKQEWWRDGSAIYYALSLDQIARPAGLWLRQHYSLSVALTRYVYIVEVAVLPLFLLPFRTDAARLLICFLLLTLFGGIMLTMMIGVFPLCFVAASALFLPSSFWNYLFKVGQVSGSDKATLAVNTSLGGIFAEGGLGLLFVLVLLWNITSLPTAPIRFPYGFDRLMMALRLNQSWGMFAPTVLKEDGWMVYRATLRNGSVIDLNSKDNRLSYTKPGYVLDKFPNDRWRKFTEQLYVGGNRHLRPHLTSYLIEKWNSDHGAKEQIDHLSIVFMLEVSKPHGSKVIPAEQVVLFDTTCTGNKKPLHAGVKI